MLSIICFQVLQIHVKAGKTKSKTKTKGENKKKKGVAKPIKKMGIKEQNMNYTKHILFGIFIQNSLIQQVSGVKKKNFKKITLK